MSIYTTPLHFGYFLGLLFCVLFWIRSFKEERTSDFFLGLVMFCLSMEIQDYTFGFAGINYLWEELNGFPRHFSLAFAPTVYLYLNAQINKNFKFEIRYFPYYLPYILYFFFNLILFFMGKATVDNFQKSSLSYYLNLVENLMLFGTYAYFFYHSLKIYKSYRIWAETQFSDTEIISFKWLRNFIYLIIAGVIFKYCWVLVDFIFDLPYEKDWWWHLFTVSIIIYVGFNGYTQWQTLKLTFTENENKSEEPLKKEVQDLSEWKAKIELIMNSDKLYLQPDLSLLELAKKMKTNASVLSAAINQNFELNFNDFINEYRVREFELLIKDPKSKSLSLLGMAYEVGFNSKATFNRAVKKLRNKQPKDFLP